MGPLAALELMSTNYKGNTMNTNRLGAACWYRVFDSNTRTLSKWTGGRLRAWSTDHVEFESGPGHFPVGVVEDDKTLRIVVVNASDITFASIPPNN